VRDERKGYDGGDVNANRQVGATTDIASDLCVWGNGIAIKTIENWSSKICHLSFQQWKAGCGDGVQFGQHRRKNRAVLSIMSTVKAP
jgi:hypothetical protein